MINNAELYERQNDIPLSIPKTVTMIGCGGVGYWSALFFAMSGVKTFYLYDPDTIELSNINRIPVKLEDVGLHKVIVLRDHILSLRPDVNVIAYAQRFSSISIMAGLVVDCTDVPRIQEMIKERISTSDCKYLRLGCEQNHITVHSDIMPDEWSPNLDATGYERVPSWIGCSVLVAIMGLCKILFSMNKDIYSNITEFFGVMENQFSNKEEV